MDSYPRTAGIVLPVPPSPLLLLPVPPSPVWLLLPVGGSNEIEIDYKIHMSG